MAKARGLLGGFRAALGGRRPSMSMTSVAVGGAALFGGTAYFAYRYAKAHTVLREDEGPIEPGTSFRVFDRLADKYDDAIGQEEAALWYGLMRWKLLDEARGDVLEVSVGTGRNFEYYDLSGSKIKSLTFTDLSQHMLLRAEDKFFDELQLGLKHPNVRTTFCLADAHCLVDPNARTVAVAPEPTAEPHTDTAPSTSGPVTAVVTAMRASGLHIPPPAAVDDSYSPPWWAYWRRLPPPPSQRQQDTSEGQQGEGAAAAALGDAPAAAIIAAADEAQATPKAMPGLNAGGLINFLRMFSGKTRSEPGTEVLETAAGPEATSEPACGACLDGGKACSSGQIKAGVPAQDACCSGEVSTCSYSQRCSSGRIESGAQLQRFTPGQFDTVIDTFGLCSHEDPVQALREMARLCKPGGKILLLEHGRSHYSWLNNHLDSAATNHQRKWGCLWNRDILALVQEAGLQVDKVTRWHFGTSYFILARPPATR